VGDAQICGSRLLKLFFEQRPGEAILFVVNAQALLPTVCAQPARKRLLVGVVQPFTRKYRKR